MEDAGRPARCPWAASLETMAPHDSAGGAVLRPCSPGSSVLKNTKD